MRLLSSLLFLLLMPSLAAAATLSGTIYTADLELAADVLVEIDSQPQQRLLSKDGAYRFELAPGNYTITLTYLKGARNETVREEVSVRQEGSFTYDLFLFPTLDEEEALYQEFAEGLDEDPEELYEPEDGFPIFQLLGLLLLLAIGVGGILFMPKRKQARGEEGDLGEELLVLLRKEGGRMSQKELRKRFPHSEAKISLVVSELEAKGRIEKIKKGRGNILVLKK